jgi:hypothetical protein
MPAQANGKRYAAPTFYGTDGITAADRFALKTAIDLHLAHTPPNPWQLPSGAEVTIAA